MLNTAKYTKTAAIFSLDNVYRYTLERWWSPFAKGAAANFLCLNPSTARWSKPQPFSETTMKPQEPKEQFQFCEGWEKETCINVESNFWNMVRGAGCTCASFELRPAKKKRQTVRM